MTNQQVNASTSPAAMPLNWSQETVGGIVTMRSGGTPTRNRVEYWNGTIPWFSGKDLKHSFLDDSIEHISERAIRGSKQTIPAGSLLILVRGMTLLKRVPIGLLRCEASFNQDIRALLPNKEKVYPEFLLGTLLANNERLQDHVSIAGHGTGRLATEELSNFTVNLPPLPEQKAIAAVLRCWDRGIQELETKVAAKEQVKNGLMQQLLSGQIRLPDFAKKAQTGDRASLIPDGWKTMPLGSIFTFSKSHAFSRERLTTEASSQPHIYNIHYGDLHARYQGPLLDFNRERRVPVLKDPTSIKEKLEFLKDGDLVMADVSEDFKGVGTCIELLSLEDRKVTGGLHTFVLRDTSGKTVEGFRGYLFKEHRLAQELRRNSTGVSVYGLSKTNLGKVLLVLPPLEEQKAIVKILNAADRELDALRRKLDNWKAQKKYLLNNLVDGRIRLPEFLESEKEAVG